jgi:hypothetical protein
MVFPCVGTGAREWALTAAKVVEYREAFPALDVSAELRRARQWLLDNPTRRKTAAGMTRFLGSWLGRAQDSARGGGAARRVQTKAEAMDDYFAMQVESVFNPPRTP